MSEPRLRGTEEYYNRSRIVPGRDGGTYHPDNVEPLCFPCNRSESFKNRIQDWRPADWRERLAVAFLREIKPGS